MTPNAIMSVQTGGRVLSSREDKMKIRSTIATDGIDKNTESKLKNLGYGMIHAKDGTNIGAVNNDANPDQIDQARKVLSDKYGQNQDVKLSGEGVKIFFYSIGAAIAISLIYMFV